MARLDKPGRFRANVTAAAPCETKSQLLQIAFSFSITEEWGGAEWTNVQHEDLTIMSWQCLEKKDKSLNKNAIANLKEVFGWDGVDLNFFGGALPPCQIVCEWDFYNGQQRLRVNWIDHFDSKGGGGGVNFDATKTQALTSRYGARLRAISGGPSATPSAPQAPAPQAPHPAEDSPGVSRDQAWHEFSTAHADLEIGQIQGTWLKEIKKIGKDESDFTPQDWMKIAKTPAPETENTTKDASSDLPF